MNVGMLWFDNDPKSNLDAKIERAADYYRGKYGKVPTLCFVHPSMLAPLKLIEKPAGENGRNGSDPEGSDENRLADELHLADEIRLRFAACGVEIRSNQAVIPNHFWIGVNGSTDVKRING